MCYVKFILNELKRPKHISTDYSTDGVAETCGIGNDNNGYEISEIETKTKTNGTETESLNSKTKKKKSTKELISNAFFLDVVRDYVNVVIKERVHNQRLILILFLAMAFVANALPFRNGTLYNNKIFEIFISIFFYLRSHMRYNF